MSYGNAINRRGMGTQGNSSDAKIPLATVIGTERAEVVRLASAVGRLADEDSSVDADSLARIREVRMCLEAAGIQLARQLTSTKTEAEAVALLRRRAGGGA